MLLTIRRAMPSDLDAVARLYDEANDALQAQGIDQWDALYPTREDFAADIEKQELFLAFRAQKLCAAWTLNAESDPQYSYGAWQGRGRPYRVVHRLCVAPVFWRQGAATYVMNYIEQSARRLGVSSIRLDTFVKNPASQQLYRKLGYRKVGAAHWRKGEFTLLEKIL